MAEDETSVIPPDLNVTMVHGYIPGMAIDGAVVELAEHADGTITADVRIPARVGLVHTD